MKKRCAILIVLIMVGALTYVHFGTAGDFDTAAKNEFAKKPKRAAPTPVRPEHMLADHAAADVAFAIVVMPKSYLPLLKQFARSKMARNLKILPAQIRWNDGQAVVIPQQAILKKPNSRTPPAEKINSPAEPVDITGRPDATIVLRKAALLMLLQGSLSGQLNYKPHRSFATTGSSWHR